MLISPAYAQAGLGGALEGIGQFLPLILIFVVFWFFLIRPQQKRAKEHRHMVAAVQRGDQVVTGGGIKGKVTKVVDEQTVQVEIADNVRVRVIKSTLTDVTARGEPAKGDGRSGSKAQATSGQGEKKSLFSFGSKK